MEIYRKLSLSCGIVYHNDGAQRYEQFLQVSQLYQALILLSLALLSSEHLCVFGLGGAIYVLKFFWLTPFSLPFNELSLVRLALDLVD